MKVNDDASDDVDDYVRASDDVINGWWCYPWHLVCNVAENTFEGKWKKRMSRRVNNQTLVVGFTHDFKCAWYKSKGKLKRMLENDHAIFLKYFPKSDLCFFGQLFKRGDTCHSP